jgi:hypothetical protein
MDKVLGVSEYQAALETYLLQMLWVQKLLMKNPPQCRAPHMLDSLYSTSAGTGILLYTSQNALFHINSSLASRLPRSTVEGRTVPASLMR